MRGRLVRLSAAKHLVRLTPAVSQQDNDVDLTSLCYSGEGNQLLTLVGAKVCFRAFLSALFML